MTEPLDRKIPSRTRTTVWSWLLIVAILIFTGGNAWLGLDAQRSLSRDYEAIQQVNRDLLLLDRVILLIVNAETGQRGYILTRDPSYREPYDEALSELHLALLDLRVRLQDYPAIFSVYTPFSLAINAKVDELANTLQYAVANDFDAGRVITEENRGQRYMEDIRAAAEDIEQALQEESQTLETARNRKQTRTILALGAAAAASIVLLWALVAVGRRDALRKEQLNELLIRRNEELDAAVRDRTRELQEANEQFDRSNRELENFAYVVSHDLQEPLRKIRAFGDRLNQTQEDELSPRSRDYIDRMQSAAVRMSTLLNDLLQFSRVNTRGLEYSNVDLNTLLANVLEDLELAIEEQNAVVAADQLPTVRGDQTQLRQLFQNLISNSLKFQPDDQIPRITVSCSFPEAEEGSMPMARIDIRDNGIGFEERYLDRIFDPFQRLHARTEYDGSGIGLAICRRVAERHGGTLTATSVPGKGSTFTVCLPLETDHTEET